MLNQQNKRSFKKHLRKVVLSSSGYLAQCISTSLKTDVFTQKQVIKSLTETRQLDFRHRDPGDL